MKFCRYIFVSYFHHDLKIPDFDHVTCCRLSLSRDRLRNYFILRNKPHPEAHRAGKREYEHAEGYGHAATGGKTLLGVLRHYIKSCDSRGLFFSCHTICWIVLGLPLSAQNGSVAACSGKLAAATPAVQRRFALALFIKMA